MDRVHQGGLVGYVILAIGALGVLLALAKLAWLFRVSRQIDQQANDMSNLRDDNPLGRILGVIGDQPRLEDLETLELKLDEAILLFAIPLGLILGVIGAQPRLEDLENRELKLDVVILREAPVLDRVNALITLLAAVAPLLGLLGTVTGMIVTFLAITLFGTSD